MLTVSLLLNDQVIINYNDNVTNKKKNSYLHENFSFFSNLSIHAAVNSILKWDARTKYFLSYQILMLFNAPNKNRLKNLVSKSIDDELLLIELKKMIDANFINIASEEVVMK